MHFDFPQPLADYSYQSYLKYLEEKLTQEVKKEDCIGHVQKRLGTALRSYKNKRCLTDSIIDGMQTTYAYDIRNNQGDQASSIAAIWVIYLHMIMAPPEVLKANILIAQMMI